jgi:hypothetical protein
MYCAIAHVMRVERPSFWYREQALSVLNGPITD